MSYGQIIYTSILCLTPLIVFIGFIIFNDMFRNGVLFATNWIHLQKIELNYPGNLWQFVGYFITAYLQIAILFFIFVGLVAMHNYIWSIL